MRDVTDKLMQCFWEESVEAIQLLFLTGCSQTKVIKVFSLLSGCYFPAQAQAATLSFFVPRVFSHQRTSHYEKINI
ncbi:hypothetical protein [Dickeya fangzhongdai]|uniref:hypothetical protein n=1 Tax=Dickeya fangzhongdai TaxID=1778540 RepID=UPI000F4F4AB8|nr:hypothetical protein [Dickeya fangzhongdai]WPD74248.1 hypothetical protein OGM23_13835 [Dickeya fangzhongdai]